MRLTGRRAALLALILAVPDAARAQTILGVVLEEQSRTPIRGAEVVLVRGTQTGATAISDSAGVFRLTLPTAGEYRIRARHLAFTTVESEPIDVRGAETVTVEIRLAPTRIPLQPIVVKVRTTDQRMAGFHERRLVHAFGRFMTQEDIDRRAAGRSTDLLRGMPGLVIVPVRVRGQVRPGYNLITMRGTLGSCEPALYLDGMRFSQSPESTIDNVLNPRDIGGVEVYNTNAGVPAQFMEPGKCGAVLFWTRSAEGGGRLNWKRVLIGGAAVLAVLIFATS